VTEETIIVFRNNKPKNLKLGFGFFKVFKNLKNLGFCKKAT